MLHKIVITFFLICISCLSVRASESDVVEQGEFYTCRESEMEIKFRCWPDWEVHFDSSADMFIISEEPEVVLTIVREEKMIVSLEQLSMEKLQVLGNYADGFKIEHIKVDGVDAIKVKAYDRQYADIRLADIYLLKEEFLYKILFSVSPAAEWAEYQFLLRDIVESFEFLDDGEQ